MKRAFLFSIIIYGLVNVGTSQNIVKHSSKKIKSENIEIIDSNHTSTICGNILFRDNIRNINDYIEQVLSLSNYAPITILIRMNGEMSLEALAKSVGMDPIVLENQLKPLHQRDLIDLRHDGRVVANIPTSED